MKWVKTQYETLFAKQYDEALYALEKVHSSGSKCIKLAAMAAMAAVHVDGRFTFEEYRLIASLIDHLSDHHPVTYEEVKDLIERIVTGENSDLEYVKGLYQSILKIEQWQQ